MSEAPKTSKAISRQKEEPRKINLLDSQRHQQRCFGFGFGLMTKTKALAIDIDLDIDIAFGTFSSLG